MELLYGHNDENDLPDEHECETAALWTEQFLKDLSQQQWLPRRQRDSVGQEATPSIAKESDVSGVATVEGKPGAVRRCLAFQPLDEPLPSPRVQELRDDADCASHGWGRGWLAGCLVLACLLGARAWYSTAALAPGRLRSANAAAVAPASQRIGSIRVGQRVVAENPDPASSAHSDETPIDPATWRFLRLRADYRWSDGTVDPIDVETLQSPEWVAAHAAQVGARVPLPLDLVELGLPDDLQATVLANEPCPAIPAGPGSVVQSTVTHLNPTVYELTLQDGQGRRQSVRPTGLHRLYSEDRQAWLPTEDLQEGEHLRGFAGSLTLVQRERVPGVHRVYNMTVHGEHVFHVSSLGLLSHNTGSCPGRTFSIGDWGGYPEGVPRPQGPFRLVEGAEYDAARKAANSANRAIHRSDASLAGQHIHEIHPVKFGGSPTDPANKIPLLPTQHSAVTNWWNSLLRSIMED